MRESSHLMIFKIGQLVFSPLKNNLIIADWAVNTADSLSIICDHDHVCEEKLIRPHPSYPTNSFAFTDKLGAGRLTNGAVPIGCERGFDDRTFHEQ